MLNGKNFGAAMAEAIKRKLASGAVQTKAEIARHFGMQPPSLSDWVKKGSVSKDKLPEVWRYFSDVAGPDLWGMTAEEWPAGLSKQNQNNECPDNQKTEPSKSSLENVVHFRRRKSDRNPRIREIIDLLLGLDDESIDNAISIIKIMAGATRKTPKAQTNKPA